MEPRQIPLTRLLGAAEAVPAALPPCRAECCRASGAKRSNRRRVVIARTTTLVAVALLGAAWRLRPQSPPPVVTAKRQVTFAGNVENSAIFPDGRFLACATHAEDSLLIFVQEVSGGNAIRIAALEHTDVESLRWSPDGARLLITGVVGTSPIAYVVARLGGDRRPIPFVTLLNDMVPFGVWMPDGQHVALWSRTRSQLRLGCLARGNYAALNATVLQLPPAGRAGRNDLRIRRTDRRCADAPRSRRRNRGVCDTRHESVFRAAAVARQRSTAAAADPAPATCPTTSASGTCPAPAARWPRPGSPHSPTAHYPDRESAAAPAIRR